MGLRIKLVLLAAILAASVCWGQTWNCGLSSNSGGVSSVTATLNNGVLTISGTGAMANYTSTASSRPWNDQRASITSMIIEEGVTTIGDYAFGNTTGSNLQNLVSVTIPSTVTSIGSYAFRGCSGLTGVTIPNSVTSIGTMTFYGCNGLTSVTIGNSVTTIGTNAFNGCSNLTEVTSLRTAAPTMSNANSFTNATTMAGMTLHYPCNGTGYTAGIWNNFGTKELMHDWEWTVTTTPKCLVKGEETEACAVCKTVNATKPVDEHCLDIAESVELTVGHHAKNDKQSEAHIEANEKYITVKDVSWSPEEETFRGGEVYTITVTLEITDDMYKFADNAVVNVNEHKNVSITNRSPTEITLEHTFPETEERTATKIEIATAPNNMTYIHGDMLDLSGLTIKTTYDDATTQTRSFADFLEYGGDINIANHEEPLTRAEHNGFEVVMGLNALKATVGKLTVNKANPTPEIPTDLTAKANQTLSDVTLPTSWAWKAAGTTAVGAVGERKHIAVFTPSDAVNYNVIERELTIEVTAATSITNRQAKNSKYGIVLEKAVVKDLAKISVKTEEFAKVSVRITDNLGNAIFETSGRNTETFTWDLRNKAGRFVANGTYLVVVEATGVSGKVWGYQTKVGVKK